MTQPIRSQEYALALGPGTRLVQYQIEGVLGQGSFGITYLASEPLLGDLSEKVAIKEFLPIDLAGRATEHDTVVPHTPERRDLFRHGLEKFLEEARRLKLLSKGSPPHIVRVRTAFEANGTAYLVMDYYEGETLSAYARSDDPASGPYGTRTLDHQDAVDIMSQVLRGLAVVHEKGFVHRDVKPDNVYLRRREDGGREALILDFGAARQALLEQKRTADWTVVLSRGYAPPEQYQRSGEQGPWTDIYACAAVLYQLITAEVPPDGDLRMRAAEGLLKDEDAKLAPVLDLAPDCPPAVAAAIERGLALEPRERPQTALEFVDLLEGRAEAASEAPAPAQAAPTVVVEEPEQGATVVIDGPTGRTPARRGTGPAPEPQGRRGRDASRPGGGFLEGWTKYFSGGSGKDAHPDGPPKKALAAAAAVVLALGIGGGVYFLATPAADAVPPEQESLTQEQQGDPTLASADDSDADAGDEGPAGGQADPTPRQTSGDGAPGERLTAGAPVSEPPRQQVEEEQPVASTRAPQPVPQPSAAQLTPITEALSVADVHLGGQRFHQADEALVDGLRQVGQLISRYPQADTLRSLQRALRNLREENQVNCSAYVDLVGRGSCPAGG